MRARFGARAFLTAMPYRIRDGLHWCECSGRIVLLDLFEDRYSSLPSDLGAIFRRVADGDALDGDTDAATLAEIGLVVDDEARQGSPPSPRVDEPVGDLGGQPLQGTTPVRVAAAIAAQLGWAVALKLVPLARIVAGFERTGTSEPPGGADDALRRLVSDFSAASLWIPAEDHCLIRALAFRSMCARRGIHPKLVFGVRLNPFRAHCWLQLGRQILIGEFEQARLFTPIAAFG